MKKQKRQRDIVKEKEKKAGPLIERDKGRKSTEVVWRQTAYGVRTLKEREDRQDRVIGGDECELTFGLRAREDVVHLVGGVDPVYQ